MPSSKDRPIVEAILEGGEVVADILMRGELLAEIPLIGTAIKVCKAADSIRDRAFAIKLSNFVLNLEGISEEQKDKLKEKMGAGTEEAQKVGETLFFILDRVTDLDKPILLSQIFLAYIDGVVSSEYLRRLCQAVDTAFPDDLQEFLIAEVTLQKSDDRWMRYLVPSGLTRLVGTQTIDEIGAKNYYEITSLGQALRQAYIHAKQDKAQ
ncbi:MAG: hypothetical protein WAW02_02625 [Sideroxyarcus sp.]